MEFHWLQWMGQPVLPSLSCEVRTIKIFIDALPLVVHVGV